MLVTEVMTADVVTVGEETALREALRLLDTHRITALPVVDGARHVVGVVSEADLITALAAATPGTTRSAARWSEHLDNPFAGTGGSEPLVVAEVMTRHPVVVEADADVAELLETFAGGVIKMVPIVRRGRLVGVVSRRDVIHALAHTDDRLCARVEALLAEAEPDDAWVVTVRDGQVEISGGRDERARRVAAVLAGTVPGVLDVTVGPGAVAAP